MKRKHRMFHMKQPASAILALAAALALTGCVSFGSKPPSQLLTLNPAQVVAPGTLRRGNEAGGLVIVDPDAPKLLDTVRVPVQIDPTSVAYVTDAQWSDTPRHLFRKLLSETIAAGSDRIVLEPGQYAADSTQRLTGELVQFGIDAQTNNAIVTFDAIMTSEGGETVAKQRFSASVPVSKINALTIGAPLNAAANKVAADVAAWVATTTR
jgi:cholesterol transport system auxiliary component